MQAYMTLIPTLQNLLSPGGVAILELGAGQAPGAAALARAAGFNRISTRSDLGGVPRALLLHGTVDPGA
jgi:release factor glutamine methyltransferase